MKKWAWLGWARLGRFIQLRAGRDAALRAGMIAAGWLVPWPVVFAFAAQAQDKCFFTFSVTANGVTQAYYSAKVDEPVNFELNCIDGYSPQVAWDFGDDTPQTAYGPALKTSHRYAAPGIYSVFARLQGEDIPVAASVTVVEPPTPTRPTHSATLVYEPKRKRVYVVNPDHGTVAALKVEGYTREFEAKVGKNPRTLALDAEDNVWVACQDDATVHVISGRDGAALATIKLPFGSRPYGITFTPDRKTAYVTLEAMGDLIRLDAANRTVNASLALGPTPRGIAISHDGKRILVTRHLSRTDGPGAMDYGEVWDVNAETFTKTRTFKLTTDLSPDGATNSRGVPNGLTSIAISPDGRFALVPATKANTVKGLALDSTAPDFQTTTRSMVMRLDLVNHREDVTYRKDIDNRSIPSSVVFDAYGRYALVTTEGTNKTPILLAHSLGDFSAIVPPEPSPDSLAMGLVRELAPIGSVFDDKDSLIFVHNFLSRDVGVYDFGGRSGSPPQVALIKTSAAEPLSAEVLFGKRLFYNASDLRMAKDGYLSCVVCHIDGGHDGRIWDFTHKGEGIRRTTDLRGRLAAGGPLHWTANFDELQDFEHDIRGAFGGTGFLSEAAWTTGTRNQTLGDKKAGHSRELDALAAYVASLATVPPSPFRTATGAMTEAGKRGREVFMREDVGCAICHAAPTFTDSRLPTQGVQAGGNSHLAGPVTVFAGAASFRTAEGFVLHNVGTLSALSGKRMNDTLRGLDAPTLKGIWAGGPYLHDGSAITLMDVIEGKNRDDKHGKTAHLTQAEKDDLVAYLRQIDDLDDEGQPASLRAAAKTRRSSGGIVLSVASISGTAPRSWAGPFSGSLTGRIAIRFVLPEASVPAQFRIFDLRGNTLAAFTTKVGQGEGVLLWDGRDRGGRLVGSGLYLVKATLSGAATAGLSFYLP